MQTKRYELPILLILVSAFYAITLKFGFVWDDKLLILENPLLQQNVAFKDIFTQSLWKFSQTQAGSTHYYRPLVTLLNIIQYKIFGPNPMGFHLVSLGLHLAIVALIWTLLTQLQSSKHVRILSCLIFGLHPVQSVTVAYISSQGDVLAVFFSLISLLIWMQPGKWRWTALITVFAGLLCKEIAAVTPMIMIAYDIFLRKAKWKSISTYAPLLAFAVYFPLRWMALDSSSQLTEWTHILQSPGSFRILRFIGRILLPIPMSPNDPPLKISFWILALSHISLILLLTIVYQKAKRFSLILFFGIWFLMGLLPIADYTNLGFRFSDQLLYFSMVPASILIAYLIPQTQKAWIGAVVFFLILIPTSFAQMLYWQNDLTLWRRIIHFDPNNIEHHLQYASVLKESGMEQEGCVQLNEILKKIGENEKIFTYRALFHNLGNCHMNSKPEAAEKYFTESIKFAGDNAWATRINLILVQLSLGKNQEALKQAQILNQEKPNLDVSRQMLEQVQQAMKK